MTSSVLQHQDVIPSRPAPHSASSARESQRRRLPQLLRTRILRVPLLGKLIGANLALLLCAVVGHALFPSASTTTQLGVVLALSFAATALLGWLALRPIVQLELIAERVSQGDFGARVPESPLADRDISRLAATMNRLLDRVQADRARIHYLAGRSVRARDIERETVARELRDSLAQMVAGIALQVAAARNSSNDPAQLDRLEQAHTLIRQLGEEMRGVAETLYPGTLAEFGLLNALTARSRLLARQSGVDIKVESEPFELPLTASTAAALYRVADEALRNVAQHAQAGHASVSLRSDGDHVSLYIEDDGCGIDMKRNDPLQAGLGLFSAKAVLALAGGDLQISSAPGLGTRVVARAPVDSSTARG